MEEEGFEILNDAELVIKGTIFRPKPRGKFPLVVISGGFFDTAASPSSKEAARLFLSHGFAVTLFDFTSGFGKSEGRPSDMTISQQVRDLGMVIQYCKRRAYVNDAKVSIFGIGLGAMAGLVMESFDSIVKALVLVNVPKGVDEISWTEFDDHAMFTIKLKRYFHVPHKQGEELISYTFFEDGQKVNMARCARNLKTPTIFFAGEDNDVVSKEQSQWLHDRMPGKKEIYILPGFGAVEGKKGIKGIVDTAVPFLKKHKVA